ncbi:TPA: hypothetical protein ACJXXT_000214 [Pseudomonas aeruginosa]
MFVLSVVSSKVKEMVDVIEEGKVFLFDDAARQGIEDGKAFYEEVYKSLLVPLKTFDWSSVTDEEIKVFKYYNNNYSRFIDSFQILIDALNLAIKRSEKRKDIDCAAKKRKYLGLIGLLEQGKKYYVDGLVTIPDELK